MVAQKFAAACLLAALASSVGQAQNQNVVLESYTVQDPMTVNKDAVTFFKLKAWKVTGGMKWYPDSAHQACLEITIADPKGLQQLETLPWCYCCFLDRPVVPMKAGTNYMGSLFEPVVDDPQEVLKRFTLPMLRAKLNPRITSSTDMPEVAKVLAKQLSGAKVRSSRIRVEYVLDGQAVEEDFYLSIFVLSAPLGVNNCTYYSWGPAWTPFSLRAAKGKLDDATPLLLSIVNSAKINPKWFGEYMYVCDLFQKRMKQGIENAKTISDTIKQNNDAITKMYSDAYAARQASEDKLAAKFSDYIRGLSRWQSPNQQYPVQLPSGYQYAWTSPSGEYVLSNDANYNPNVGSNLNWQALKPAK
jgi:hypothetical protein